MVPNVGVRTPPEGRKISVEACEMMKQERSYEKTSNISALKEWFIFQTFLFAFFHMEHWIDLSLQASDSPIETIQEEKHFLVEAIAACRHVQPVRTAHRYTLFHFTLFHCEKLGLKLLPLLHVWPTFLPIHSLDL